MGVYTHTDIDGLVLFFKKCMSTHTRTCKRKTYPLHWTLFLRRHWELIKNHFGKRDKLFVCVYKGLTIKIWGYNQYAYRRGGCLLLDLSKSSIELPFVIIVISHCLKKCYIIVIYRQDLLKISVQFFFILSKTFTSSLFYLRLLLHHYFI